MGITLAQAVLLATWARRHKLSGNTTTLGVQHLDFSRHDFDVAMGYGEAAPRPHRAECTRMTAEELFSICGFRSVIAVDVSGHEGAQVAFDLNSAELPPSLAGSSDLVVNGGTLEHVFHVPNALANMTHMLAPGGSILHILPCHNCVDHGFYQFGPTFVFDYYRAANFEILESAAVALSGEEAHVLPVPEGRFGTGLIGALKDCAPLLYVALVRKTAMSTATAIPMQRLYAAGPRALAAAPRWFPPFRLAAGAQPVVAEVREHRLGGFAHAGGLGWICALPESWPGGDSMAAPIGSPVVLFEGDRLLGPPHTPHAVIMADGAGAFSHWGGSLMMSTSDGSDPRHNGRAYIARMPVHAPDHTIDNDRHAA